MSARCLAHDDRAAAAKCVACDREMCEECWTRTVDTQPTCEPCSQMLVAPISPLIPVLGTVLVVVVTWLIARRTWGEDLEIYAVTALASVIAIVTAVRRTVRVNRARRARVVAGRLAESASAGTPYRGALRSSRALRRMAPPLSGSLTVFVVGAAFALSAGAIPSLVQLPRWLAAEAVLGVWWVIWTITLTALLYRGWRIARDR